MHWMNVQLPDNFQIREHSWPACFILCERQRALYGMKCVLRIFWQTWMHILTNKKNFDLCKHVPCNTLTHSTNEDLLNIKCKGDPEALYPLLYVRYHRNPCVIKVILLADLLILIFFNSLNLFCHTDKNFCFYAEVNFWDFVRNETSAQDISTLFRCTGWAWNCPIIFRFASIHGRACFILNTDIYNFQQCYNLYQVFSYSVSHL